MTNDKPKTPPSPPKANGAATKPTMTQAEIPKLVTGKPEPQMPRILLEGVEGFGKTSCGAYAPDPIIMMAKGETGYLTLLDVGIVPDVPRVLVNNWRETLGVIANLIENPQGKLLVLDAMGGLERFCHEYTCETDYKGVWGDKGFGSYQKGYDTALTYWIHLLDQLDRLREKGIAILMLSHVKTGVHKDPIAPDFDKFMADLHQKTRSITHKWSDAVLFGNFITTTADKQKGDTKAKGIGDTKRVIYTERRAVFDAKNRYNMPVKIDIPDDSSAMWSTIINSINTKKKGTK